MSGEVLHITPAMPLMAWSWFFFSLKSHQHYHIARFQLPKLIEFQKQVQEPTCVIPIVMSIFLWFWHCDRSKMEFQTAIHTKNNLHYSLQSMIQSMHLCVRFDLHLFAHQLIRQSTGLVDTLDHGADDKQILGCWKRNTVYCFSTPWNQIIYVSLAHLMNNYYEASISILFPVMDTFNMVEYRYLNQL